MAADFVVRPLSGGRPHGGVGAAGGARGMRGGWEAWRPGAGVACVASLGRSGRSGERRWPRERHSGSDACQSYAILNERMWNEAGRLQASV